ncbi:hypothetical protein NLX83_32055 [Allokutzneria sp. A3M-2-11 16]|uniref:hypothetical protein n=1 Tax=Allokutzneria sp. A3M-2-11 16 TaxID=2962043 RepID=UPI0020B8F771|nr:hypothetical protein [Allokutzneria sp. A3M-2-11 16]MCP3803912.1 hypothetical protein [Allokutzneria sp. A3M-2-11 16]
MVINEVRRRPVTLTAAAACTTAAAALLLTGMLIEQAAGAPLRHVGWPAFWALLLGFFAAMTFQGRLWGRVTLAALVGLVLLQLPVLVHRSPGLIEPFERPAVVVDVMLTAVALHVIGAVLALLPAPVTRGQISLRLRGILLPLHTVTTVAWIGMITVQGVLGVTAATTASRPIAESMFTAMLVIDGVFLGPMAFLAFFSGLALALGTRWGLFRRWWLAVKFGVVLVLMMLPVIAWQDVPEHGSQLLADGASLGSVQAALGAVPHLSLISPALAVAVAVLSVRKPWGLTPHGRSHPPLSP